MHAHPVVRARTRCRRSPRARVIGASIEQKRVPDAVFGSAVGLGEKRPPEGEPMGALERFKRAK